MSKPTGAVYAIAPSIVLTVNLCRRDCETAATLAVAATPPTQPPRVGVMPRGCGTTHRRKMAHEATDSIEGAESYCGLGGLGGILIH